MTKFNYKTVKNIILKVIVFTVLSLITGCASTMSVDLSVIPQKKSNTDIWEQKAKFHNVLVLIAQGQSNQEFAAISPDSIGALVMQNPTKFKVFHISGKGDDFNLKVEVNPENPVAVYVVGDGLVYGNDSQWKYYYNKLDDDTLDLEITPYGVVRKQQSSSWF